MSAYADKLRALADELEKRPPELHIRVLRSRNGHLFATSDQHSTATFWARTDDRFWEAFGKFMRTWYEGIERGAADDDNTIPEATQD